VARERVYWLAAADLARRDWQQAQDGATAGLKLLGTRSNDELRWRLATIGAIAAQHLGNDAIVAELAATGRTALARVQTQWGPDFVSYRQRPDLADLLKRAEQK
jgi:hypothetical protein